MNSIMGKLIPIMDLEQDQKFDNVLVERLVKIIEVLPNIEE
jgi:hypothetical protein